MIKIGIVGGGLRGQLFARSFEQLAEVAVVGVADPTSGGQLTASELGVASYPDHGALLSAEAPDAVVVATPDFAHRDAAVDAAHAGAHLLVEKPLATSVADAHAIRDAVRATGVKCVVAFENRWNPRFATARAMIERGELGEVLVQCGHLNDTRHVPLQMLSWAAASSPAWFLMPHTVDLALWLSGHSAATVHATSTSGELDRLGVDTLDAVQALVRLEDGSAVSLLSNWVLPTSFPSVYDFRYEVTGTRSALFINAADQGVHLAGSQWSWPQHAGAVEQHGRLTGIVPAMARSFCDLLSGASLDLPDVDQGVAVTELIAAIDTSIVTGTPVPVAPAPEEATR